MIDLRNYLGRRVTLAQYRGKAVLVTFLYTNCPDICPLITSNLRVVLNELGAEASHVQVIAVSVDPRGDTPAAVGRFLGVHEMVGRMQYLIGSAAELGRTWAAWGVGSTREAANPDLVAHSALVYGVSASGRLTTIYPPASNRTRSSTTSPGSPPPEGAAHAAPADSAGARHPSSAPGASRLQRRARRDTAFARAGFQRSPAPRRNRTVYQIATTIRTPSGITSVRTSAVWTPEAIGTTMLWHLPLLMLVREPPGAGRTGLRRQEPAVYVGEYDDNERDRPRHPHDPGGSCWSPSAEIPPGRLLCSA